MRVGGVMVYNGPVAPTEPGLLFEGSRVGNYRCPLAQTVGQRASWRFPFLAYCPGNMGATGLSTATRGWAVWATAGNGGGTQGRAGNVRQRRAPSSKKPAPRVTGCRRIRPHAHHRPAGAVPAMTHP